MTGPSFHSLRFDPAHCTGCMSCARACPTQAVRVRRGHAVMLEDRCIDCGECLKACTKGAVVPLSDSIGELSAFRYKVAIPCPALYSQFDSDVTPGKVLEALKLCGFDDAVSLSPSCDALAVATEIFLEAHRGPRPLISSFCPSVVRLIQTKYPSLVEHLVPLMPPRELAAKEVKAAKARETGLSPESIAVVYITPCPAKLVSIADHPGMEASHYDSAVSFRDLYQLLAGAVAKVRDAGAPAEETESASGVSWAFLGGVPRAVPAEHSLCVAGLSNVIRILDDVEKGRLRGYSYIECHSCSESCVSGALTVENPYVARARSIRLTEVLGDGPPCDRSEVERRYREGHYRAKATLGPRPLQPLDRDISKAIAKMREREQILSRLPGIDCCACGAPTCEAFAEDVVLGEAGEAACVFLRQREVDELVERLSGLLRLQRESGPAPGGMR